MRWGDVIVEVGPPKQRAVLALLLLRANEVVASDVLIDQLWDGRPPRTAAHSVQIYVSELRRAFADVPNSPIIVTSRPGYRLDIHPEAVDAHNFEMLAHRGINAARSGDTERGRAALRDALAVWRTPPLADFTYEDWAQPHIARLEQIYFGVVEELAAIELEMGNIGDAIRLVGEVMDADRLRERAIGLQMTALYRSGNHVEALRRFTSYRRRLAEELGVVPSPNVERLYERILLHDPALLPVQDEPVSIGVAARNPYKGLRPFREHDADDFFGRSELVEQLVSKLRHGQALIALVGPSGSGKSSVISAGLVPALRAGAVEGSERWLIASTVPGTHPLEEANAAITRAASELAVAPAAHASTWPVNPHAGFRITSGHDEVLLVVDQFEELFAVPDERARRSFLDAITQSTTNCDGNLRVVLTLRADHYDRPLQYADFAAVFTSAVVNVLPMQTDEVEAAVTGPAARVVVSVQPALLAQLVADTHDQPGSLPLLQYALTAQFNATRGRVLSLADYEDMGGMQAILARHAEQLFESLDEGEQEIAVQTLLRMVRIGQSTGDGRRRVLVSELTDIDVDPVSLSVVLDRFGQHRLLSFDRDTISEAPTVELAHEALLTEWPRLANWIKRHRNALVRLASLRAAIDEWEDSGRQPDYLVAGRRLAELDEARRGGMLTLTSREHEFIVRALEYQHAREAAEASRAAAVKHLTRRARNRLVALGVVVALLIGTLAYSLFVLGGDLPGRAVLLTNDHHEVGILINRGFDRGVSEFEYRSSKVRPLGNEIATHETEIEEALAENPSLVFSADIFVDLMSLARTHPDVLFVSVDEVVDAPNVASLLVNTHEGSYLAGVAAALTTKTGAVAFLGGVDEELIWEFSGGFIAGARSIDPDIRVATTYLADPPHWAEGYADPVLGEQAGRELYLNGADVVFAAAGESGLGVFRAAVDISETTGVHRWVVGVDTDQYETIGDLPGLGFANANILRKHILTSVIKGFDQVIFDAIAADSQGGLEPGVQLVGLADGAIDISYSGGYLDDARAQIEMIRQHILDGDIDVPCRPPDRIGRSTPERPHPCAAP